MAVAVECLVERLFDCGGKCWEIKLVQMLVDHVLVFRTLACLRSSEVVLR